MSTNRVEEYLLVQFDTSDERGWLMWKIYLQISPTDGEIYLYASGENREGEEKDWCDKIVGYIEDDISVSSIQHAVQKALDQQWNMYPWEMMIDDTDGLTDLERIWAKDHISAVAVVI